MADIIIQSIAGEALEAHADALAEIIAQTVNDGAAIGFMQPFSKADGRLSFTIRCFRRYGRAGAG